MQPVYLFDLAARNAQWASLRQATITANIANANTPGYSASDVEPFSAILNKTHLTLARTAPGHIQVADAGLRNSKTDGSETWEVSESGNTVSLEQEMLKASEVNGTYAFNTSIVRSFHRMMLASVRTS